MGREAPQRPAYGGKHALALDGLRGVRVVEHPTADDHAVRAAVTAVRLDPEAGRRAGGGAGEPGAVPGPLEGEAPAGRVHPATGLSGTRARVIRRGSAHGAYFLALSPAGPLVESAAMNASWGTSTRPTIFIRFLPSFCFSSSLRLRVMSPP